MDPSTVQVQRENLLQSLKGPENFNEWLQGAHYSSRYVSLLERTDNNCSQALRASNAAMMAGQKTHHRPPRLSKSPPGGGGTDAVRLLSKSRKKMEQERQAAAAKENSEASEEASEEAKAEEGEKTQPSRPHHRSGIKKQKKTPAVSQQVVDGSTLSSEGIRDHLRESYYHMKSSNAFGNTFPALLTPYNRPVWHVYDEDSVPRRYRPHTNSSLRGGEFGSSAQQESGSGRKKSGGEEAWRDMTRGMMSGRNYDYPYQNEVLNETCIRNLLLQPGGPPSFYPSATRPLRAPPKEMGPYLI